MQVYNFNSTAVAAESFGNEVVLINLLKGNYYSFRGDVALFIWTLLEQGTSERQIMNQVVLNFDIEIGQVLNAISPFIHQLLQEEIIVLSEVNNESEILSNESISKKAFSVPYLEVYDDLQAVLMLDPVHDVDVQKGWPHKKNNEGEND